MLVLDPDGMAKNTLIKYSCLLLASVMAFFMAHEKGLARGEVKVKKPSKIYVLPVGDLKISEIKWLCPQLEKEFKLPCEFLSNKPIPVSAYHKERGQYHSTVVLRHVHSSMPSDAVRLLAVVNVDLFVPELNFVFGEASIGLKTAVISTYRLHQSTYNLPEDKKLFKRRLMTEAVHELGHTFGLGHCDNPKCVMYFSKTLADTDRKGPNFCPKCSKQITQK